VSFKLYAFKSEGRTELLRDHIKTGLRIIKELYIHEGYHKHVVCRMASMGVEFKAEEAEAAICTAYIYHDSGKAMDPLQSMIRRGRGARGHEVLSAYLAYLTLREWREFPEDVNISICLAILLHMSALRHFLKGIYVLKDLLKETGYSSFQMVRESIQEFNLIVSDSWHKLLSLDTYPPIIQEQSIQVKYGELKEFVKDFMFSKLPRPKYERLKTESARRWLMAYMILHPLLIADEYAVAENTGKRPRPWAREFAETTRALRHLKRG